MKNLSELEIAIFADGAEKAGILEMYAKPYIRGFTTNPTLMRKAGVADYESFARDILQAIPDRHLLRGLRRRVHRDGEAGAQHCDMGQERLGQDPDHQYAP
jgi:transaldolase